MTDLLRPLPTSTPHPSKVGRRRRAVLSAGLAVGLLVAAIAVGVGVSRDDNPSSPGALAPLQLASMQQTCEEWTGASAPHLGGASASVACVAMTDWMSQQLRSGHMTGTMMFGSATTMGAACSAWMATEPAAIASGSTQPWCDDMVTWMTQHIGNWDEWMTHGRMMGR